MNNVRIRSAAVDDAKRIAQIHCASWRDAYANVLDPVFLAGPIEQDRRAVWKERLSFPTQKQVVLVAETPRAELAAFLCLFLDRDACWGSLMDNLHVAPDLRGRRIGEQLMRVSAETVCSSAANRSLYLWVLEDNQAGRRFYERLGGQVVERSVSEFPAANKAPNLRMFWPDISILHR